MMITDIDTQTNQLKSDFQIKEIKSAKLAKIRFKKFVPKTILFLNQALVRERKKNPQLLD